MLLNLFVSMSQPSFLLANESNHLLLQSLLDAMSAILEHQYEGTSTRHFVFHISFAVNCCSFEGLLPWRDMLLVGALS